MSFLKIVALCVFTGIASANDFFEIASKPIDLIQDLTSFYGKDEIQDLYIQDKNLKAESYKKCNQDEPCLDAPYYICSDGLCYHKPVFPTYGREWGGYVVVAILMGLCNVAGIGGGAIDQPIMQVFFKFFIKQAIAISNLVILMSSIARFFYTFKVKNPEKPFTPVVDYSLATIMIATTLAGSQIGSQLFLKTFPPLIIQILLEILLIFLAIQSVFKAREIHKKESEQSINQTLQSDSVLTKSETLNFVDHQNFGSESQDGTNIVVINDVTISCSDNPEVTAEILSLQKLAQREEGHGQWIKQLICFSLIGILIFMNLSLGSSEKPSIDNVKLCGVVYWGIQGVFIIICCVVTYFSVKLNKKEQDLRKKYNINFSENEVIFEGKNLTKLLIIGFVGGWVAGALGLGGGSIYNPALLSMGVNPRVAASTGMYLVIFSCINACVVNFIGGILDVRYGVYIGGWVIVGSILGLLLADHFVKKSGKQSIFVWILSFVFFLCAIITPFVAYNQLSSEKANGTNIMAFYSPC